MNKHLAIGVLGCGMFTCQPLYIHVVLLVQLDQITHSIPGKLGTAILRGLLSTGSQKLPQSYIITRVTVSGRSDSAANRTSTKLKAVRAAASTSSASIEDLVVQILRGSNRLLIWQSDGVVLGCKPYDFEKALGTSDVRGALLDSAGNKTLVSILGGVSTSQLWACVRGGADSGRETNLKHRPSYSQYSGAFRTVHDCYWIA